MSDGKDANENPRRRALLAALSLAFLAFAPTGCGRDAAPHQGIAVSNDVVALGRLIKLPADVTRAQWQTGPMAAHGGDWWLAAILDLPPQRLAAFLPGPGHPGSLETPPGMLADGEFTTLKSLPGATPLDGGGLRLSGDVHGIAPFASSPLLHGGALQLSPTRVFVLLWTT